MVNETELPRISEHCVVRLDNFIIVIGGRSDGLAVPPREIWSYNLYTDKWEKHVIPKKRAAPRFLHHAVAVAIESTIYTFGGRSTCTNTERNDLFTLRRTETGDFTWTFIKHQCDKESPSPRDQHTGWEYARKLWVFGGEGPSPEIYLNDYGDIEYGWFHRNNQLLSYDPDIRKWTNPQCFGAVPSPRSAPCSTINREKVWLFGGFNRTLGCLDDLFQLNMQSLTWMQIQAGNPRPATFCGYTLTAITDNQLILLGCFSSWIMDLTSHSWRRYTSGNHHVRSNHTTTLGLNSSVIVIGGWSGHGVYNGIFHVMLEPMSLQKLAAHMIYMHQANLPWKCLPKKLITMLGISGKKQGSASSSSSSIEHSITT